MVVRGSNTRTPSKPPLRTSIPIESWEQIAQARSKSRGLIRKGSGKYEAKPVSESEQKRVQRKARAQALPTAFFPQTSLVLSATSSLKLSLVSSTI